MPKAIDPLLILREHFTQNKKIERKGQYLVFSNKINLKIDTANYWETIYYRKYMAIPYFKR